MGHVPPSPPPIHGGPPPPFRRRRYELSEERRDRWAIARLLWLALVIFGAIWVVLR